MKAMWNLFVLFSVFLPFSGYGLPVPSTYDVCDGCTEFEKVDVEDEDLKAVTLRTVQVVSNHLPTEYYYIISEIHDAERSVCSQKDLCGITAVYRMNVTLGLTNCLKKDVRYKEAQDCPIMDSSEDVFCFLKVREEEDTYYRSWNCKKREQNK